MTKEPIANRLGRKIVQAKVWLKKAAESGSVEKLKKPVRFTLGQQASLLE